jgi:hypothetical protein
MNPTSVRGYTPASAIAPRSIPIHATGVRGHGAVQHSAAFAIAVLILSGCGQNVAVVSATGDQTAGGTPLEPAFTQFPDMPIPEGGNVDLENTLVFGGGNYWFGRLVITTSFGPNEMFDFYANQLPSFGWDAITSLRSTISVLTYAREDRVATIQIQKRTIRGAEVTVTVSPRGASQTPTAAPATAPQVLPSR